MYTLQDIIDRKIINNVTSKEKLEKAIKEKSFIYCGFDPSAASLHLGNYAQIIGLRLFNKIGLKPICILGTGTGLIGDPSGKLSERILLDKKTFQNNCKNINKQLEYFFKDNQKALILKNDSWYKDVNIIDFLRDIGKYINISQMIHKENVAKRIETGISFTEFAYTLLQAWDFSYLYDKYNCHIQLGGSDQWGNITTGIELIRKIKGEEVNKAAGITLNLLTNENGEKFGKSVSGAIFLDRNLTSPYEMYQFLFNQTDDLLPSLFKTLTMLDLKKISDILSEHEKKPFLRYGQKMLAAEILVDIHGKEQLDIVLSISHNLYKITPDNLSKIDLKNLYDNITKIQLNSKKLPLSIKDFLLNANIFTSNREINEFIHNGAIKINGIKITDANLNFNSLNYLHNEYLIIQKGKHLFWIYKKNKA